MLWLRIFFPATTLADMDWSSLVAASLGAAAALCGVLLTQRFERRKVYDDRMWQKRSEVYLQIGRWAHEHYEFLVRGSVGDSPPADPRSDTIAALRLYGSLEVFNQYYNAFDGCRSAVDYFYSDRDGPMGRKKIDTAVSRITQLQQMMVDDVRRT